MDRCHYYSLFSPVLHVSLCAAQDENDYRILSATNTLHAAYCHFKVRLITQVVLEFILPPVSHSYESLIYVFIHSPTRSFIHSFMY